MSLLLVPHSGANAANHEVLTFFRAGQMKSIYVSHNKRYFQFTALCFMMQFNIDCGPSMTHHYESIIGLAIWAPFSIYKSILSY